MEGWILRVYPLKERNLYRLVIKTGDKYVYRDVEYNPRIYLDGDRDAVKELIRGLGASEYLVDYGVEKWFKPPWYRSMKDVWYVAVPGPNEYREVIKWVREDGRYRLWNTYPNDIQQMMHNLEISTSTLIDPYRLELLEDPWSIEYEEPPFKRVRIRILDWYGDVIHPFRHPPKTVKVEYIDHGVVETYTDAFDAIEDINRYSPDIFEFYNTPAYHWFRRLDKLFRLESRVYIDYGWNVLEPDEYHGYIELSRLSKVDIHEVSRYSIGKVLTTIEAYHALELRRLIPDVRTDMENFKTLDKLSRVDRGGYIHSPEPGIYWNVAQCDFTSLYPSIMVKYNIGNETVNYRGCRDYIVVPEAGYRICRDIRSTVAYTLDKILTRRITLKDMARERGDPILDARQTALKWILVTCFGYLGYRNARFGKIEAYECVTSYARYVMYRAIDIARDMGFNVIHAYVDSIWISKEGADEEDYIKYCMEVYRDTGFRMEIDSIYRWLYIPTARGGYGDSSINRYIGALVDGGFKAKGIEMVRRDSPGIVKIVQEKVLDILSKAGDYREMKGLMVDVAEIVAEYIDMLSKGDIDPKHLVITKKLGRGIGEYISRQPHVEAAKTLGVEKGYVKYIVSERGYIPVEIWGDSHGYDRKYYIRRVVESLYSTPIKLFIDEYGGITMLLRRSTHT